MIDPKKQYVFDDKRHPYFGKPVTQLHRFETSPLDDTPWVGVVNGTMQFFSDDGDRLREVDPVLYYTRHYTDDTTSVESFEAMMRDPHVVARSATHASGKVRQIPLDATTDPEGGAA